MSGVLDSDLVFAAVFRMQDRFGVQEPEQILMEILAAEGWSRRVESLGSDQKAASSGRYWVPPYRWHRP